MRVGRNVAAMITATLVLSSCTPDRLTDDTPSEPEQTTAAFPYPDSAPGAIQMENTLPGTDAWKRPGSKSLDVFGSPYAPRRGDTLYAHVGARNAEDATFEVFRLGWYNGLGGRLIVRIFDRHVTPQPPCTPSSPPPVECPWAGIPVTVVDSSWLAGVYVLRVRTQSNAVGFYPFVVSSTRQRALLGVVSQFTWQAYNKYGGSSLYTIDPTTAKNSTKVSFERPYLAANGLAAAGGSGASGGNDVQVLRFIEREGFDIGYLSDLDLADSTRTWADGYRGLIFLGHDEYWTWHEFDVVEAARDAGHHLAFLSANVAYWQIRLERSGISGRPMSRIACFRSNLDPDAPTPQLATNRFRALPQPRPENALVGVMFVNLLPTNTNPPMTVAPDSLQGVEAANFLAAAGLSAGDTLGLVHAGDEVDQIVANGKTPAGIQIVLQNVFSTESGTRTVHSTFYRAPSGAGVFATGTNRWGFYLDDLYGTRDPRVIALTRAVLQEMSH